MIGSLERCFLYYLTFLCIFAQIQDADKHINQYIISREPHPTAAPGYSPLPGYPREVSLPWTNGPVLVPTRIPARDIPTSWTNQPGNHFVHGTDTPRGYPIGINLRIVELRTGNELIGSGLLTPRIDGRAGGHGVGGALHHRVQGHHSGDAER